MQDKPYYSRISDILDLAVFMQSKSFGITLLDIMKRYGVSRRTAERMRDSLLNIFPSIDIIENNDKQKHWGFVNYSISPFISFNKDEIIGLENLIKRTDNKELKHLLEKICEKIIAINTKNDLKPEENIKLLMQSQGYAIRQTSQYKIDLNILENVKNALLKNCKLKGIYHKKQRILEPLGLIYGEKTYLVAYEKEKGKDVYTYALHKFEKLEASNEKFEKYDFDLQKHANKSFGIFQGEILNVELEFNKDLTQKAKNYFFHPTQKIKELKNGNLLVKFKASGEREIIYNVFRWGAKCKINKPASLKKYFKTYLKDILNNY